MIHLTEIYMSTGWSILVSDVYFVQIPHQLKPETMCIVRTSVSSPAQSGLLYQIDTLSVAFQEFTIVPSMENIRILTNEENLPWTLYVGVAGMPGV